MYNKRVSGRTSYGEKREWLSDRFPEVEMEAFYSQLFPPCSFESQWKEGKPNGMICNTATGQVSIVLDDHEAIASAKEKTDMVMAPLSYFGKHWTERNASFLFAFAIDLDDVFLQNIKELWHEITTVLPGEERPRVPKPTYIVLSGGGLHIYYFLKEPIPLYNHLHRKLNNFKKALSGRVWNKNTSTKKIKELHGIFQGYRMVGSWGSLGKGYQVRAYKTGEPVDLDYLNLFVPDELKIKDLNWHSSCTLEEAKEKYPDWYHTRIVMKQKYKSWTTAPALFNWWKQKIYENAMDGNRYHCLAALAVFAAKCDIKPETVEKFALDNLDWFNTLTQRADNRFTKRDIKSALKMDSKRFKNMSRKSLSEMTGVNMPANKRNHRKRAEHIKLMNFVRDNLLDMKDSWRNKDGAPTKEFIVKQWRACNPDGTKKQCQEDTGLSRPTIIKWWGEPPRKYETGLKLKGWTEAENARRTKRGEFQIDWSDINGR